MRVCVCVHVCAVAFRFYDIQTTRYGSGHYQKLKRTKAYRSSNKKTEILKRDTNDRQNMFMCVKLWGDKITVFSEPDKDITICFVIFGSEKYRDSVDRQQCFLDESLSLRMRVELLYLSFLSQNKCSNVL